MSTFSGLGAALSALTAQSKALEVAGQNVANANTEGYSRQRVDMASLGSPAVPALWSTYHGAGSGVTITDIRRVVDQLLAGRAQAEHGQLGYLSGRKDALATVETAFGEPSDNGLQATLADFWASWHDLSNNPGSTAVRTVVLQQAQSVVDGIHRASSALTSQWQATRSQVDATVRSVSDLAAGVATLNAAIVRDTASGLRSNELQDQRDQLVSKLSDAVGAVATPRDDGSYDVVVGGTAIVTGTISRTLSVSGGGSPSTAATDPVVLTWNGATYPASLTSGSLAAQVETANVTVPGYRAGLDSVAAAISARANAVQVAGYDAAGAAGTPLFSGGTADTLIVAIVDPAGLAASAVAPTADPVTGLPVPNLDGSNADAMAALGSAAGGADSVYRTLVAALGAESATVASRAGLQQATTSSVDQARAAQSGVNVDEEMVSLMAYQHAYEGAARVLTSVDSMLDTLVNRTGLVGR